MAMLAEPRRGLMPLPPMAARLGWLPPWPAGKLLRLVEDPISACIADMFSSDTRFKRQMAHYKVGLT